MRREHNWPRVGKKSERSSLERKEKIESISTFFNARKTAISIPDDIIGKQQDQENNSGEKGLPGVATLNNGCRDEALHTMEDFTTGILHGRKRTADGNLKPSVLQHAPEPLQTHALSIHTKASSDLVPTSREAIATASAPHSRSPTSNLRSSSPPLTLTPLSSSLILSAPQASEPRIQVNDKCSEETRKLVDAVNNSSAIGKAAGTVAWQPEEDNLLLHLKEVLGLKWLEIAPFFSYRGKWYFPQGRYSKITRRKKSDSQAERHVKPTFPISEEFGSKSNQPNPSLQATEDNWKVPWKSASFEAASTYPDGSAREDDGIRTKPRENLRRSGRASAKSGDFAKFFQLPSWQDSVEESPSYVTTNPAYENGYPDTESQDQQRIMADLNSDHKGGLRLRKSIKTREQEQTEHIPLDLQRYPTALLTLERERNYAAIGSMSPKFTRAPTFDLKANVKKRVIKRRSVQIHKPYLTEHERTFLSRTLDGFWDLGQAEGWDGQDVHVDFTETEMKTLEKSVLYVVPSVISSLPIRNRLLTSMKDATLQDIERIAFRAITEGPFLNRTVDSIKSFLIDIANHATNEHPLIQTLAVTGRSKKPTTATLLRKRELDGAPNVAMLRSCSQRTMGPTRIFKGTSSDVNTLAWSPNGRFFAVGSAALTDNSSMQYNRPNNLLFGDFEHSRLLELPQHVKKREASSGVNATAAMQVSQDPLLFTSIADVRFSADGKVLITAGYDKSVRLFAVGGSRKEGREVVRPSWSLPKQSEVDLLAVPSTSTVENAGLFAAATKTSSSSMKAVRLYSYDLDGDGISHCGKKGSFNYEQRPELQRSQFDPSSLRFSESAGMQNRYLLGGFSARDDEEKRGEACLWDVETGKEIGTSICKRCVFDIQWSPSIFGRFAIGSSPKSTINVNRGTHTTVRIHDSRWLPVGTMETDSHPRIELECPAYDMNDILFNRYDDNIVSAGCTDGVVYVWDLRRPNRILHQLGHGTPLNELDESRPRQIVDTGVRFLAWGADGRRLFTGSSDGVVASWNPYLATQNAFESEVVHMDSGIMAGGFSPDFTSLLLGDVQGSILTLSVGCDDVALDQCEEFEFIPDEQTKRDKRAEFSSPLDVAASADSGKQIAQHLVRSGEIDIQPYGDFPRRQAVQGPRYAGPFDNGSDAAELRHASLRFQARARATIDYGTGPERPTAGGGFTDSDVVVDDGRWRERIPQAMFASSCKGPAPAAAARFLDSCSRCRGRRPSAQMPTDRDQDPEHVICDLCGARWRGDVLGYELISDGPRRRHAAPQRAKSLDAGTQQSDDEGADTAGIASTKLRAVQTLNEYLDMWEIDPLCLR